MRKLLLLVLAACTAMAIAECANSLYVRFDEDFYLRPGYGWDIQGGSIRVNAMSPAWPRYFDDLGNTVFVLVRQDTNSLGGNEVGSVFVKDINGDFESSVVKTTEPVSYYCEEGAQQSLSFEFVEKEVTVGGSSSSFTANFVRIADSRPYAFGMDGEFAVNEVYALAESAGGFGEADLFFETAAGWVKAEENAFVYLGCCEPECIETAAGCESVVATAEKGCKGGWLYSFSCLESACVADAAACEYGCSGGACLIPSSCDDSDNGALGSTKGAVTVVDGGEESVLEDYCASGYSLVEYYCSGLTAKSKEMNCAYGCFDGACAPAPDASEEAKPSQEPVMPGETTEGNGGYGAYAAGLGLLALLAAFGYWLYRGGK